MAQQRRPAGISRSVCIVSLEYQRFTDAGSQVLFCWPLRYRHLFPAPLSRTRLIPLRRSSRSLDSRESRSQRARCVGRNRSAARRTFPRIDRRRLALPRRRCFSERFTPPRSRAAQQLPRCLRPASRGQRGYIAWRSIPRAQKNYRPLRSRATRFTRSRP